MGIEEEVVELQKMDKQLQELMYRKMQIENQLNEIRNALEELEKSEGDVYRLVGGILVKVKREKAIDDLKKSRDLLERALHKYGEEERVLREKLNRLSRKLSQSLGQNKGG